MQTTITSLHFELTEAMKNYILSQTQSLEKYQLNILNSRIVVTYQEKKGSKKGEKRRKRSFGIDIILSLAHSNTLVINQVDKDFYTAVDVAIGRMHKLLRRYHDRQNQKFTTPAEDIMASAILREEAIASRGEDEIVPMDLDLHKPLDIQDALERLKSSSQQFFVFNDKDSKMRVIYKRIDGKYGLY